MNCEIREMSSEPELKQAFELLKELRPWVAPEQFPLLYRAAHQADDYRFYGAFLGSDCVGVMGARILHDYVHGKHLYIDDLVVVAPARSKGIGAAFLRHAEMLARANGCSGLRLCTGTENEALRELAEPKPR